MNSAPTELNSTNLACSLRGGSLERAAATSTASGSTTVSLGVNWVYLAHRWIAHSAASRSLSILEH